jgi:phenylacetate-CoA ligase
MISPSVVTFAFKGVTHIERAQVAQVGADRWVVRMVPLPGYHADDGQRLLLNFRQLVTPRIDIALEMTSEIPLHASGKFKWVSQEYYRDGKVPA